MLQESLCIEFTKAEGRAVKRPVYVRKHTVKMTFRMILMRKNTGSFLLTKGYDVIGLWTDPYAAGLGRFPGWGGVQKHIRGSVPQQGADPAIHTTADGTESTSGEVL